MPTTFDMRSRGFRSLEDNPYLQYCGRSRAADPVPESPLWLGLYAHTAFSDGLQLAFNENNEPLLSRMENTPHEFWLPGHGSIMVLCTVRVQGNANMASLV
jgi:hypothetical protein